MLGTQDEASSASKFRCSKCSKFKLPDPTSFSVGDRVKFMRIKHGARSSSFSSVSGRIVALDGDDAVLVRVRGKDTRVLRTGITHENQPSPVSYAFIGTCTCGGESC